MARQEFERVSRPGPDYDPARASELQYSSIPALEEATIDIAEGEGNCLIKDHVDADDIAAIIARWTGIPVAKLMEGE